MTETESPSPLTVPGSNKMSLSRIVDSVLDATSDTRLSRKKQRLFSSSSNLIFRELPIDELNDHRDDDGDDCHATAQSGMSALKRANPIQEQADQQDPVSGFRTISPYPCCFDEFSDDEELSSSNQDAVVERLGAFHGWPLLPQEYDSNKPADNIGEASVSRVGPGQLPHDRQQAVSPIVDYSRFFECQTHHQELQNETFDATAPGLDGDDFSLASENDWEMNISFEGISEDPASFWETGVVDESTRSCFSPTQVSLQSSET